MLADAADDVWQPLTQRDAALIATLRAGPLQVCSTALRVGQHSLRAPAMSRRCRLGRVAQTYCADWLTELDAMEDIGVKAEIEAAYSGTGRRRLPDILAEELHRLQLIRHHDGSPVGVGR